MCKIKLIVVSNNKYKRIFDYFFPPSELLHFGRIYVNWKSFMFVYNHSPWNFLLYTGEIQVHKEYRIFGKKSFLVSLKCVSIEKFRNIYSDSADSKNIVTISAIKIRSMHCRKTLAHERINNRIPCTIQHTSNNRPPIPQSSNERGSNKTFRYAIKEGWFAQG